MKRILTLLLFSAVIVSYPCVCISQQETLQTNTVDTMSTKYFRMTCETGISGENLLGISDVLGTIYGDVAVRIKLQNIRQIPVILSTSIASLIRRVGEKVQTPVVYRRDTLFLVSWYDAEIPQEQIQPLLRYVVAFAVLDRSVSHGTPLWLKNGYALRYGEFGTQWSPPLMAYMRSFEDFSEEQQLSATPGVSSDYQYLLLKTIDYLITRYGEEKFVSLFTLLNLNNSLADGFEKAFGDKYGTIEKEWRAYIDTKVGKPVKQK